MTKESKNIFSKRKKKRNEGKENKKSLRGMHFSLSDTPYTHSLYFNRQTEEEYKRKLKEYHEQKKTQRYGNTDVSLEELLNGEDVEEDEKSTDDFYCPLCEKRFKSSKQYEFHLLMYAYRRCF
jgi:hypothetical protein